jgi:hypothetical protein
MSQAKIKQTSIYYVSVSSRAEQNRVQAEGNLIVQAEGI